MATALEAVAACGAALRAATASPNLARQQPQNASLNVAVCQQRRGGRHHVPTRPAVSPLSQPEVRPREVKLRAQATEAATAVPNVEMKSDMGVSYETLRSLLAAGEWEEADNETRRLVCVLAGEGAVKRKWVYFTEVQFMPEVDLQTIDSLWKAYSNGKYGFSVQRKIWNNCGRAWKLFFNRIGWTTGERCDYRKFPVDFLWNCDPETPTGHLPLTNALRGTQLLEALLGHPAFEFVDKESTLPMNDLPPPSSDASSAKASPPGKSSTMFTPDYSF